MADIKNRPANRLDADESPLFARANDYLMAQVFEEKLAPTTFRQFIPVTSEMPAYATTMTRRYFKGFGKAKMISDYQTRGIPRVDVGGHEVTVKAKDLAVAFGFSIDEIRRAIAGGVNLEQRRASMARVAIERKLDSLAWIGDADYGIQGLIMYPGSSEVTIPATGSGSSKLWSTKTAAQIITDLNMIKSAVYQGTAGVESIDTILLPMAQLDLIRNTNMGTGTDTTVYEYFLRNNPGLTIAECRALDSAGTGSSDIIMGYRKSPEYVRFELPIPLEALEPERDGMQYTTILRSRVAGTILMYPATMSWGYGI